MPSVMEQQASLTLCGLHLILTTRLRGHGSEGYILIRLSSDSCTILLWVNWNLHLYLIHIPLFWYLYMYMLDQPI
jgi:hypothetical protein